MDIDGVVSPFSGTSFDPNCMQNLKNIVTKTNAKIVLSSTWRTSKTTFNLVNKNLGKFGIEECISKTPENGGYDRGAEILEWLEENKTRYNIVSWIAIDDMDLSYNLGSNFIHCSSDTGLTDPLAKKSIQILLKQ
uniref:Uncharacterized protein n=1 Tax=Arcella intermedia TaxID=1963864 RepID=A0A6B2LQ01_9EUKA